MDAWLSGITIRKKITLALVSGVALGLLIGFVGLAAVSQVSARLEALAGALAGSGAELQAAAARELANGREAARQMANLITAVMVLAVAGASVACILLVREIGKGIGRLLAETGRLGTAVGQGELDVRGAPEAVGPEFRCIVERMNQTMEAFAPMRDVAGRMMRLSRGDLPEKITAEFPGQFGPMKQALNAIIDNAHARSSDLKQLTESTLAGRLEVRVDLSKYAGYNGRMMENINTLLDTLITPLRLAAGHFERIARGDVPQPIAEDWKGEFGQIKANINTCIGAVNALVADAEALSAAAVEGRLSARADPARHQGDFRKIIEGVNRTLDAVVSPLQVAATYVERISKGDIPQPITDAYAGEFASIRDSLNRCIAAIGILVDEVGVVIHAGRDGDLARRASADRTQGVYRKVLRGVNDTLDAIVAPIRESSSVLEALARRDLTARVAGDYKGDHAQIKDSLNLTARELGKSLAQVAEAVGQVANAAGQIAASSQAVAGGASEQASALEETTAQLESMAAMTKESAGHARQAEALAATAKEAAGKGTVAMDELRVAMASIRSTAEGTSQIIKDINEIAFQTNLLALNAAVEAARAGEAGRGFAVVAEEVRSLALRSKEAAAKTEERIRQSVKEAEQGAKKSQLVNGQLAEITKAVDKVSAIVGEIAAASREQAAGIEQVSKAVGEMDKVTQLNAASSEESSSTAEELSSQSEELAAMVGSFRLEAGATTAKRGGAKAAAVPKAVAPKQLPQAGKAGDGHAGAALKPDDAFPMDADPEFKEF
jgi:methyl-accepting chemotaxis protein